MYQIIRSVLFFFDAEKVHYWAMKRLQKMASVAFFRRIMQWYFKPEARPISFLGLDFKNPVGLAAGFDKNALYLDELDLLGFSHVEIGTVTPRSQPGNDLPRLFRLPEDKALLNRMGFNNDGADLVVERLKNWREKQAAKPKKSTLIIGGNIGKNKSTPNDDAYLDYDICFRKLYPYVDYFVVNVSSPNTPGLRELQEKPALEKILSHLQEINRGMPTPKPLLLKIAPDLTDTQLDDVIDLAVDIKLDGLVATNTTLDRESLSDAGKIRSAEAGAGGLSGQPVKKRSTEIVRYISQNTRGNIPVIASGGVFTTEDALEKMNAGAQLVQVWTGFIYEGPSIVKKICKGL